MLCDCCYCFVIVRCLQHQAVELAVAVDVVLAVAAVVAAVARVAVALLVVDAVVRLV